MVAVLALKLQAMVATVNASTARAKRKKPDFMSFSFGKKLGAFYSNCG
jgi:hypothetical protein